MDYSRGWTSVASSQKERGWNTEEDGRGREIGKRDKRHVVEKGENING